MITTLPDDAEIHVDALVTVYVYVPAASPDIVALVPVPVLVVPPGVLVKVHVPDDGSPLNTTLPVATAHVGCVMAPTVGAVEAITVKLPDVDPVDTGLEDVIRNLYVLPVAVLTGITPLIVPEVVLEIEPMAIGEVKFPSASLSCNVNVLPAENTPNVVYEILTFDPAHV